jgi:hypothetical protein
MSVPCGRLWVLRRENKKHFLARDWLPSRNATAPDAGGASKWRGSPISRFRSKRNAVRGTQKLKWNIIRMEYSRYLYFIDRLLSQERFSHTINVIFSSLQG